MRSARSSIRDALGLPSQRVRPLRAGDYSFNQIGPTGLYMLLSNIPIEERKRRGYYAVGGCGGNIAWHTPDDLMPVADLEILRRDLAVYLTTIVRILNAPLHPFDYAAAVDEIRAAVAQYQQAAGGEIDFAPVLDDLAALAEDIRALACRGRGARSARGGRRAERRRLNAVASPDWRGCSCRSTTRAASASITIRRSSSARCRGSRRPRASRRRRRR